LPRRRWRPTIFSDGATSSGIKTAGCGEPLRLEHDRLVREIENLTRGIAQGGDIPALAAALDDRDRRLMTIAAELSKPSRSPTATRCTPRCCAAWPTGATCCAGRACSPRASSCNT